MVWRSPFLLSVALLWSCEQLPDEATSPRFDFERDALSFANFGDRYEAAKFNAELASRMFGADAVCQPGGSVCAVDPNVQVFIDTANNLMATGHSEGFAVLSQLFAQGKLKPADFGRTKAADFTISDDAILAELAYFAATQQIEAVHDQDKKLDAKAALAFLAESFDPKATDAWRMMVAIKKADGSLTAGHSLVPFGYFKTAENKYTVRLYDPNFPRNERRMDIDIKENSWRYDGTISSTDPLVYEGNSGNGNVLFFSPVSLRLGTFKPPHTVTGFSVTLGGGVGLVTGADNEVGFKDGKVVEKGGLVLPGGANCACTNSNETVQFLLKKAGLPQTITLTAKGATVTGNNVTVQVNDYADKGSSINTEEVSVTADGKAVVTHKGAVENDPRTVTVVTKNADGSTTSVTVTTSGNTDSITIDTSDPTNVKVTGTSTAGTASQVEVTVTNTQADGTTKTVTNTSSAGEGRNINVTAQPIAGTSTAMNGLAADSCKNGRRDVDEVGVDCGAACAAKAPADRVGSGRCARYEQCETSGDCELVDTCVMRVCLQPSCSDGVKNGNETDVDCGASPCGGCAFGKACSGSNNCATGLVCDMGACAVGTPVSHRLTISGLGNGGSIDLSQLLDGVWSKRTVRGNATGAPFDVVIAATTSLRVALSSSYGDFTCAFDQPRDDATWYWRWDVPAQGPGMASLRSMTCQRSSGRVSVPFVINGCQFHRVGTTPDGGIYVPSRGAPKFYDETTTPHSLMWWVNFYDGDQGNGAELSQTINAPPLNYNISIGPDTTGFCKLDNGWSNDPDSDVRYTMSCLPDAPLQGTLGSVNPTITPRVFCSCTYEYPDAGPVDAGFDAGTVDAGFDAGTIDAGFDAGTIDAGFDAGTVDAGPTSCSLDSQCGAGANCFCAGDPGNCAGAGVCIGTKAVISAATNGVNASGTYTVPVGCSKVHISAWGAAGGLYSDMFGFPPVQLPGGAGGYVAGSISASPGDVISVWVGAAGQPTTNSGGGGVGSFAGTGVNGGNGDGSSSGGGGGLTSVQQTGSVTRTFSIPGGGGAGATGVAFAPGEVSGGGATGQAGEDATPGSGFGAGGAGDPGGTQGDGTGGAAMAGAPGAFGTLPSGIVAGVGSNQTPGGTTTSDFNLCPGSTATGNSGGNGCVVVRCAQ